MAEPLELRYGLDSFRSDWRHCALGSDFLAETAFTTPYAKQVASTAINELLEIAFRLGAKGSKSWVQVRIDGSGPLQLTLDLPLKPTHRAEIEADLARVAAEGARAVYEERLGSDTPGALFGAWYLVVDFDAEIQTEIRKDTFVLRATVPLRRSKT